MSLKLFVVLARSESDGIDYELILKIVEELETKQTSSDATVSQELKEKMRIETSADGAWTFAPESMRSIPKD